MTIEQFNDYNYALTRGWGVGRKLSIVDNTATDGIQYTSSGNFACGHFDDFDFS